jgi:hypothetical protein
MNPTLTAQIRTLQTAPAAELADRYTALFGKPPRIRNRAWLFRQVAWKLQERELGGLSERARTRLNELLAKIDLPLRDAPLPARRPTASTPAARDRRDLVPGTELTRQVARPGHPRSRSRRRRLRLERRPLRLAVSAVAKAITGASWNGRLFFNLVERRPAS